MQTRTKVDESEVIDESKNEGTANDAQGAANDAQGISNIEVKKDNVEELKPSDKQYKNYTVRFNKFIKSVEKEYKTLSPEEKNNVKIFLENCGDADKNLASSSPDQNFVKSKLSNAASALQKLNSRPIFARGLAVLSVVAAAAAVAFLWPAAVVASLGITATYLGVAAATASFAAATFSGLSGYGMFQKSKYNLLKAELAHETQGLSKLPKPKKA